MQIAFFASSILTCYFYKMIKLIVVSICVVLLSASCQQKENNKIVKPSTAQSKDSSTSFPIMEILKEDVKEVQKIPYFIYKKTTSISK